MLTPLLIVKQALNVFLPATSNQQLFAKKRKNFTNNILIPDCLLHTITRRMGGQTPELVYTGAGIW